MNLQGKRVLITGATGFIGNRLAEVLGRAQVDMRALVHQFMNAARLARFPVQMYGGSITDEHAVAQAMEGVDVVFHLAFGSRGSDKERHHVTVDGARTVCEAALRAGVSRVVYTSTFSVYGVTRMANLTEAAERQVSGDVYADSKLEAEKVVLDLARTRGLPAVILQPTIVYGPYAFWSTWPITQLKSGTVVLPDGGGVCNALYIDDAVNALVAAATAPAVEGEVFLISGGAACNWSDYFDGYARMVPGSTIEFEPYSRIRATVRSRFARSPLSGLMKKGLKSTKVRQALLSVPSARALYNGMKAATPRFAWDHLRDWSIAKPHHYPLASHLELYQSPTTVSIDKAVRMLEWKPEVDLTEGLLRTRAWANWFGLTAQ